MSHKILLAIICCLILLLLTSCDGDFLWVEDQKIVLCATLSAVLILCCIGFYKIKQRRKR